MNVKEAKEQYSHFNAIEVYTPTDAFMLNIAIKN